MKNVLATAVVGLALALLVPSNGAEAVRLSATAHAAMQPVSATLSMARPAESPAARAWLAADPGEPDSTLAWLMALGFLGAVAMRRMRD